MANRTRTNSECGVHCYTLHLKGCTTKAVLHKNLTSRDSRVVHSGAISEHPTCAVFAPHEMQMMTGASVEHDHLGHAWRTSNLQASQQKLFNKTKTVHTVSLRTHRATLLGHSLRHPAIKNKSTKTVQSNKNCARSGTLDASCNFPWALSTTPCNQNQDSVHKGAFNPKKCRAPRTLRRLCWKQNCHKMAEVQISHRADNDLGYKGQLLAEKLESSPVQTYRLEFCSLLSKCKGIALDRISWSLAKPNEADADDLSPKGSLRAYKAAQVPKAKLCGKSGLSTKTVHTASLRTHRAILLGHSLRHPPMKTTALWSLLSKCKGIAMDRISWSLAKPNEALQ